jgi:hypothetical protein
MTAICEKTRDYIGYTSETREYFETFLTNIYTLFRVAGREFTGKNEMEENLSLGAARVFEAAIVLSQIPGQEPVVLRDRSNEPDFRSMRGERALEQLQTKLMLFARRLEEIQESSQRHDEASSVANHCQVAKLHINSASAYALTARRALTYG